MGNFDNDQGMHLGVIWGGRGRVRLWENADWIKKNRAQDEISWFL